MTIGDVVSRAGFVTRQINLQGQSLREIEVRLGYHAGRLSKGAYFLVALELPQNSGFDLAGYSQVAAHHTNERYGNLNDPSNASLDRMKNIASSGWGLTGKDRLVKIVPVVGHDDTMTDDDQYPVGSGIPQWKLTQPIKFLVEDFVVAYPSGRFIPKQGFQEVKYT